MNNRLEELGLGDGGYDDDDEDVENAVSEIEMDESGDFKTYTPEDSKFIDGFYNEVGKIKTLLKTIEDECDDLRTAYGKSLSQVQIIGEKGKDSAKKLSAQRKGISGKLNRVKERLRGMENLLNKMKEDTQKERNDELYKTAEYRMRENLYNSLLKRSQDVITKFQQIELEYQDKKKGEIKRKLRIVTNKDDVDEEELQKFMEDPKKIFMEKLAGTQISRTVQSNYDEAVETRDDLLELETSMNEIIDMFTDLHELLKIQGENIDNIQDSVVGAINYVEKGADAIKRGRGHQKKTKCFCIIAVFLGIILALLIIIILAVLIFGGGTAIAALATGLAVGL